MGTKVDDPAKAEVGLVLYRDCQLATVHGLTDLLTIASYFSAQRGGATVRISHWQLDEHDAFRRVYDSEPTASATDHPTFLVVPGRLTGPMESTEAPRYANWLRERHAAGTTLVSSCIGTFVLGETGLLDKRPATTHWLFANQFRDRFPGVRLEPDRIVIEDGDIITAGGLMAWTDLGMRIVDRLFGPTVMLETGRFLLIDPAGREQRHYSSFAPRLTHGDEPILKVQHWLQERGAKAVSVTEMAKLIAMEERTFQRRFKAATGMKPTEYSQRLRIGKARELLEFTKRSVDQIAWAIGYEDAAGFRKLFHRLVGLSPSDYRRRFAAGSTQALSA